LEKVLVTGGAGFIGSNLVDELLSRRVSVNVLDNLVTGRTEFLETALTSDNFRLFEGSTLDKSTVLESMAGCDTVFHLQANADVRWGLEEPSRDLQQNTVATFTVLEAMREAGLSKIVFSSTGAIYGDAVVIPTPEDAPFPVQTSLYGASKLACEGLISAYAIGYGMSSVALRFAGVLGERLTHGHLFDFYRKLKENPNSIEVLGDGRQVKTYVYVKDVVEAVIHAESIAVPGEYSVYNVAVDETSTVMDSVKWIGEFLGINPETTFTGGDRGWIGDSPLIHLDNSKLQGTGWSPTLGIKDSVFQTLRWLSDNEWAFDGRLDPSTW